MKKLCKYILLSILLVLLVGVVSIAEESEESPLRVYVDNHTMIAEDIRKEFQKYQYDGMVTEVYSINNTIPDCYYRPLAKDVPYLEESVLKRGFINAYTGYFDLDHTDEYKPENHSVRAVEVLGSDSLIMAESYEGGVYNALKIPEVSVPSNAAVMGIYKALDLPQYEISYYPFSVSKEHLRQSPAVLNLPAFVKDVNPAYGKMLVFVTRTNMSLYAQKAQRDMKMANDVLSSTPITSGEFIVLVRDMMDFYGEPRMSEAEMQAVLQVYGGSVPQYLTSNQKDAYLYLKARGILNDDTIDFSEDLTLSQMLEILMCVKDEGSRTDFKKIQITMDISDKLKASGYFPKKVILSDKNEALQIDEEYDYSDAQTYDYFVEKTTQTTFVNSDGAELSDMFIPSIPANPESTAISGFEYAGIETGEDGKEYYHYVIPIMSSGSDYMKVSAMYMGEPGWVQINTLHNSDMPAYIWLKQGGGVYTYHSTDSAKGVALNRRAFKDGEFEGAASEERKGRDLAKGESSRNILLAIVDKIFGEELVAKAAVVNTGVKVKATVYNAHNISNIDQLEKLKYVELIDDNNDGEWVNASKDTLIAKVDENKYSMFLAMIKRDSAIAVNEAMDAIADITGETLLDFRELADRGILFYDANGNLPQPNANNPDLLVIDSVNGRIVVNNELKQIVVGSTVYQLTNQDHQLFESSVDENGKPQLMVDFRVAYGWSANTVDIEVVGTGTTYNVNITTVDTSVTYAPIINKASIVLPDSFSSGNIDEFGLVIVKGAVGSEGNWNKYLTTSGYTLSNWIIFQQQNNSDYLFVYYLKDAFTGMGIEPPNDWDKMQSIVGYSIASEGWAVRVLELTKTVSTEPGKFSYIKPFGYIYNLPPSSDFTMEKYLKGEYLLPLTYRQKSGDKFELCNYNVNYFPGYAYGTRPRKVEKVKVPGTATSQERVSVEYIDVKGNTGSISAPVTEFVVKAAPAGVHCLYGGYIRNSFSTNSGSDLFNGTGLSSNNAVYVGTSPIFIRKLAGNGEIWASLEIGTDFRKELKFDDDTEFNQVAKWGDRNGNFYYRYVTWGSVLEKQVAEKETDAEKAMVVISDAERKDEYVDMDKYSLEYLLYRLDSSTSWIIIFCLKILPYVGIILLTILLGLSFISDIKIVQQLFAKTIDPVKVLTFGKIKFEELRSPKMFLGLLIGYCMFALIMDGNLIRIIIWASEAFSTLVQMLRQL